MSDTSPTSAATRRIVLNAVPPVRPLAIAAAVVVLGAVLLVLWRSGRLSGLAGGLGAVLMVLGVALALAAVVLAARLRTEVTLDATAITVRRSGRQRSLPWEQVVEVTAAHPRLTLVAGDDEPGLTLVNPRAADDPRFAALTQEVRSRLDTDRGYTELG